jgi:hypothetical protein
MKGDILARARPGVSVRSCTSTLDADDEDRADDAVAHGEGVVTIVRKRARPAQFVLFLRNIQGLQAPDPGGAQGGDRPPGRTTSGPSRGEILETAGKRA